MSLDLAFGIAKSGLLATQRQLAQVSQNIANADTPGYTRKELPPGAVSADGSPLGVRLGEARRSVDDALLAERDARGADAAAAEVRERLLSRVEAVHGRPEDGDSLGDVIGRMRESFVAMRASPADTGLQQASAIAAREVAARFNEVGRAVSDARQGAHDGVFAEVQAINARLSDVATLTQRIRDEVARGRSPADLEDERDVALRRLSESLPVKALRHADGDLTLIARNGLALPTDPRGLPALSVAPAALGPDAYHGPPAGALPGVMLNGVDVTRQVRGGRLAEFVALRDETLPRFQAELDVAAATLARRLDAQGLRLFVDASGAVPNPSAGYVAGGVLGFANGVRINPAVASDQRLLRDGTHAVAGGPPLGFAPNPAGGPTGFVALLDRVLEFGFGARDAAGADWPPIPTAGLGPNLALSSPFLAPRGIEAFAATVIGAQTQERAEAEGLRARAEALRAGLETRIDRQSGVDPDAEMAALVRLQNAYAANARVVNTAQQMFDALLAMGR